MLGSASVNLMTAFYWWRVGLTACHFIKSDFWINWKVSKMSQLEIHTIMRYIFQKCWSLEISWVIYERSSSCVLKKKPISEPQTTDICRTCSLAHYLSLGSSMVGVFHRSEECGLDPPSGAQKSFSEDRAWRTFIYHSTCRDVNKVFFFLLLR